MKEEKNDVDMNVQCCIIHVGKDSWKGKVPSKAGSIAFHSLPE